MNYSYVVFAVVFALISLGGCSSKCEDSQYGTTSSTYATSSTTSAQCASTTNTTGQTANSCYNQYTGKYEAPVNGYCPNQSSNYGSGYNYGGGGYDYGNSGSGSYGGGYMTGGGYCYNPYTGQSYYPYNGGC